MDAPYWVLVDYGGYEGIRKHAETMDFDEAVKLREETRNFGSPVYIVQLVPLDVRDGRKDKGRRNGENNPHAKLTADDVRAIRASSEGRVALSKRFGVSESAINDIIKRRTWQ